MPEHTQTNAKAGGLGASDQFAVSEHEFLDKLSSEDSNRIRDRCPRAGNFRRYVYAEVTLLRHTGAKSGRILSQRGYFGATPTRRHSAPLGKFTQKSKAPRPQ